MRIDELTPNDRLDLELKHKANEDVKYLLRVIDNLEGKIEALSAYVSTVRTEFERFRALSEEMDQIADSINNAIAVINCAAIDAGEDLPDARF